MGAVPSSVVADYDCSNVDNLRPVAVHEGKPCVVFKKSDKARYLSMMKHILIGKFSHGRPTIALIKEFFVNLKLKGELLLLVANTIRKPLRVDSHNVNRVKLGTASVCIELDVSKPLMHETWISFVDDEDLDIVEGFSQKVEYESVPPYSSKCFHMGFKEDDCKRDFELEKSKGHEAPHVYRRRNYRRVVNPEKVMQSKGVNIDEKNKAPMQSTGQDTNVASISGTKEVNDDYVAPAVTPYVRHGHLVEKWIKMIYNKHKVVPEKVVPEKKSVPIANYFDAFANIRDDDGAELKATPHVDDVDLKSDRCETGNKVTNVIVEAGLA
ncbi:hypothetical protein LIER_36990 [Lithospermum erythrorhizon]|uniref:Uncharacterized protein n=1 Tax=Lithospermum erythrorhizon TaxID=34254 RepID=A0AAV3PDP7_LITER